MKVILYNWASAGKQMVKDGFVHNTEREMTPEEICGLIDRYSIMLVPREGQVILFLDERGRRFSQR